jgi:hypothetical protein
MQANLQRRHRARATHRIGGSGTGDHQAGGRQNAVAMGALDGFVDALGQTEIVGRDGQAAV